MFYPTLPLNPLYVESLTREIENRRIAWQNPHSQNNEEFLYRLRNIPQDPTTIKDLPSDILDDIFKNISVMKDLQSLCDSSKGFRDLTNDSIDRYPDHPNYKNYQKYIVVEKIIKLIADFLMSSLCFFHDLINSGFKNYIHNKLDSGWIYQYRVRPLILFRNVGGNNAATYITLEAFIFLHAHNNIILQISKAHWNYNRKCNIDLQKDIIDDNNKIDPEKKKECHKKMLEFLRNYIHEMLLQYPDMFKTTMNSGFDLGFIRSVSYNKDSLFFKLFYEGKVKIYNKNIELFKKTFKTLVDKLTTLDTVPAPAPAPVAADAIDLAIVPLVPVLHGVINRDALDPYLTENLTDIIGKFVGKLEQFGFSSNFTSNSYILRTPAMNSLVENKIHIKNITYLDKIQYVIKAILSSIHSDNRYYYADFRYIKKYLIGCTYNDLTRYNNNIIYDDFKNNSQAICKTIIEHSRHEMNSAIANYVCEFKYPDELYQRDIIRVFTKGMVFVELVNIIFKYNNKDKTDHTEYKYIKSISEKIEFLKEHKGRIHGGVLESVNIIITLFLDKIRIINSYLYNNERVYNNEIIENLYKGWTGLAEAAATVVVPDEEPQEEEQEEQLETQARAAAAELFTEQQLSHTNQVQTNQVQTN